MNIIRLALYSIIVITSSALLTACSTTAPTTLSNGKVYYVNSDKCANYRIEADNTTITCFDENGNETGQAQPMSPEAIAIYNQNLQLQLAQIQENLQKTSLNLQKAQQVQQSHLQYMQNMAPRTIHCNTYGFYGTSPSSITCTEY